MTTTTDPRRMTKAQVCRELVRRGWKVWPDGRTLIFAIHDELAPTEGVYDPRDLLAELILREWRPEAVGPWRGLWTNRTGSARAALARVAAAIA